MRLAFIGGGVMAEAIIGGILEKKLTRPQDVSVGELLESRRAYLKDKYAVKVCQGNVEAAQDSDILILSIKPQNLSEELGDLKGRLSARQTVLSIVAGARMETLVSGLGGHTSVIRVMPNTPAQIGQGMSVWTASQDVDYEHREAARSILQTMGEEIYVSDEKYIDMATALSASGPAYVFLFIEALIDAGVYLGMPRDMARTLTLQTVLGSAKLAKQSGRHPAELRDMVTSPGGTTAEALLALEAGGFRATLMNAVIAAYEKSQALGSEPDHEK